MSTLLLKTVSRLKLIAAAVCVCGLSSVSAFGADSVKALMVQLKAGDAHYYVLADKPVVQFDAQKCSIASSALQTEYDMAEIDFANFVDYNPASVSDAVSAFTFEYVTPSLIAVRGLDAGSSLAMHRVDGVKVADFTADNFGAAEISLAQLPAGVYILSCKEKTFKILHSK